MSDPPSELMLFAAGFGSRMQPLTIDLPKPLIHVAGQSLLDRTLALAHDAEISKVVVNTHYLGHKIRNHLQGRPVKVIHEPEILDTGGGLKNAKALFKEATVFTSNSDAVWSGPNPFSTLALQWRNDYDALLLCAPVNQIDGRSPPGDFSVSEGGKVIRGGDWVYLGIQIIRLDTLDEIGAKAFSLNVVWDQLMDRGTLRVAHYSGQWCDIGKPENVALGIEVLRQADV